jgi:hypothetical protein
MQIAEKTVSDDAVIEELSSPAAPLPSPNLTGVAKFSLSK